MGKDGLKIEGKIAVTESVEVARSGVVRGEVEAESLSVSGQMSGRAATKTRIEITPEGKVAADLTAPRILIADGAQFKGNIDMG